MPTLELRNFTKKWNILGRHGGNKISILPGLLPQHLWRKNEKIFFQNFDSQSRIFWLVKKCKKYFSILSKLHFQIFQSRKFEWAEIQLCWKSMLIGQLSQRIRIELLVTFSCQQNSVNRGTLDVTIRLMKLNWWQGLLRQRFGDSCFIIWVTTNNVFV